MAKLHDMLTQARRAQGGGGIGFLGKNKSETKPRAAALVVEFPQATAGSAEAALKAGADGLLFQWDGKDSTTFETLKKEITAARSSNSQVVIGLEIVGGLDQFTRERFTQLKEQEIQYVILPFNAPARLLAFESKDLEKIVTVPMREGDLYPVYIRNLSAFDGIAGVLFSFELSDNLSKLTIEEALNYRAVREAVRFPAFIHVAGNITEDDAYTLLALGINAVILTASDDEEATREQIKSLRVLLENVHKDEQDKDSPSLPSTGRKS